ncbi:MAG: hypothetical protein HY842_07325 [Bacteroidetes bacterium]|nr:hypothetical protein [Bacteroidota bacterium]
MLLESDIQETPFPSSKNQQEGVYFWNSLQTTGNVAIEKKPFDLSGKFEEKKKGVSFVITK